MIWVSRHPLIAGVCIQSGARFCAHQRGTIAGMNSAFKRVQHCDVAPAADLGACVQSLALAHADVTDDNVFFSPWCVACAAPFFVAPVSLNGPACRAPQGLPNLCRFLEGSLKAASVLPSYDARRCAFMAKFDALLWRPNVNTPAPAVPAVCV